MLISYWRIYEHNLRNHLHEMEKSQHGHERLHEFRKVKLKRLHDKKKNSAKK